MIKATALCLSLLGAGSTAFADPGYYVVTAYDNEGQRSIDLRYWTVKTPGSPATLWPEIGFGYGVTTRWYTEVYGSFIGTHDTAFKPSTWNWQNEYLLTQGQYPFDLALHATLTKEPHESDGYGIEYGPVLQTDFGRTQVNLNVFFERDRGEYAPDGTQMKYQWQLKRRWLPALQFGAQGFGELGRWDHWAPRDQQSHRAGPALFGELPLGGGTTLRCQAAILWGSTYARHGDMFSARAQLVF
jgi:hypothetical protein